MQAAAGKQTGHAKSSSASVISVAHLVFGMCCQQVECSNGKIELARVRELADLLPKGHQVIPADLHQNM